MNSPSIKIERDDVPLDETCVQRLMAPDPAVNSEDSLFFHWDEERADAGFDTVKKAYFALKGAKLQFDSYFNVFPAHLYDLDDHRLFIEIEGDGEVVVDVILAKHRRSDERLARTRLALRLGQPQRIDLPDIALDGLIYVGFIALTDVSIGKVDFIVRGRSHRDVTLTGVITTFKRNDAVQKTAMRLQDYFNENQDLGKDFSLLVVDNGGDTVDIPFEKGEVIQNPNLGGAGGFTRGLQTVVDRGLSSHVLFMDDDANFFPESLRRTISLLRFTRVPNLAVSGAMITEAHKSHMWENGATFNRRCQPIDKCRDIRLFKEVLSMFHAQPRHLKNKYGGWWYFCFPVASVKTWPFPFFVRGDDSYFSLSNEFDIVTLPGVVAHQEDFFSKQTPLTLYLDMRYHIVHHLTFDRLDIGKRKLRKMVARYFDRFNNAYHYESARAINLAISDVLKGEEFWETNADMADRRKYISDFVDREKIRDNLPVDRALFTRHSAGRNKGRWATFLRGVTFNGHLLPDRLFYTKGILFPLDVRGIEHDTFLRRQSITMDQTTGRGYICEIDRRKYFENRKEFLTLARRLEHEYDSLRKVYSGAISTLTTKSAWEARFRKPTKSNL